MGLTTGDSGGPLFLNREGRMYLIGLASISESSYGNTLVENSLKKIFTLVGNLIKIFIFQFLVYTKFGTTKEWIFMWVKIKKYKKSPQN